MAQAKKKTGKVRALYQAWVKALRSGRYRQTSHQLRAESKYYCCLGVLCTVEKKMKSTGLPISWNHNTVVVQTVEDALEIPLPLKKAIGLTKSGEDRLIAMNDDQHKSFKQIADYIEKKYL